MGHILQVQSASASDIGQKRANNEDSVGLFEPGDEQTWRLSGALYVVADGVGGAAHGEVASRYAVQKVLYEYYRRADVPPEERLAQIIQETGNEIYAYGHSEAGGGRTMATTLVAAVVWGDRLIVANVGDSRAYLVREGRAEQITVDHNLVGEMVHEGLMTPEEARHAKVKNRLTRSLGGRANPKVDIFTRTLQPGDRIVLCSDGLTRYADAEDIARLTAAPTPAEAVQRMVAFANQRGGADNVSAIVVVIGQPVPLEEAASTGSRTQITAPPPLQTEDEPAEDEPAAAPPEGQSTPPPPPATDANAAPGHRPAYFRWAAAAALLTLVGCVIGSAVWWGTQRREPLAAAPPTTTPAAAALLPTATPTASATPSPTLAPSPTPPPTPTPTAALAAAPLPSPTWTALPPGTYACLGVVLPGGSFYGLLARFGLLGSSASAMEFWETWAKPGRFPEVWVAAKTALRESRPVDYHTFRRVPVPQQNGPGSAEWEDFVEKLALHPDDAVILPGVGRTQCVAHGGIWQPFKSLPPWMRSVPLMTPPSATPAP